MNFEKLNDNLNKAVCGIRIIGAAALVVIVVKQQG